LAAPFAFVIVGWLLIPYIMRLRVTTAYELLETRLGLSVRLLGLTRPRVSTSELETR
jgi:SSS family solute:Na+ symporter